MAAPADHSQAISTTPSHSASVGPLGTLTNLVVKRLFISDDVAAAKFGTSSPIDDPVREQQELDEVSQRATEMGLDPTATVAFFKDQISASKVVQKGDFARWTAHPEEAPTTRPDLGQIRIELDQLTTQLLDELKTTAHLRAEPLACSISLAIAAQTATVLGHLDTLHRQALDVATHDVCETPRHV
ncbi:chorismate mutase [Actinoplanes sp. TBRC 11911]|nr:chorismate mutase [Actinoplanes sp. TBRC 11911]